MQELDFFDSLSRYLNNRSEPCRFTSVGSTSVLGFQRVSLEPLLPKQLVFTKPMSMVRRVLNVPLLV